MGQQITSALSQSTHRVLAALAGFLPGVLALLLALIVFTLIGLGLMALLRRLFTAIKLDERLASRASGNQGQLADWSPSRSPSLLVSQAVLWLCILLGLAVGIFAFDASSSQTTHLSVFLLPYLTHLTGAALLLIFGNLIARFLARSVLIGAVNAQLQYARFLSLGVKWLVLVLAAAMALDHLQIGGTVVALAFGILFGGIVLTLSLAIGLGSRDLVSRSIEKSMDKPASPTVPADDAPHPRLRHF
jgi:uncharacterized membrane protein